MKFGKISELNSNEPDSPFGVNIDEQKSRSFVEDKIEPIKPGAYAFLKSSIRSNSYLNVNNPKNGFKGERPKLEKKGSTKSVLST